MLKTLMKVISSLVVGLIVLVAGAVAFMPGIHISSLSMMLNVVTGSAADTDDITLKQGLKLPEGYSISVYARGIANPRMMWQAGNGHLLVSSPRSGEIIQISDEDGDGNVDSQITLIENLVRPHGLEVHEGYLYVAESNQVGRIQYDALSGEVTGNYQVVVAGLSDNGNHWSKTIRFDQQGWLYLSLGSTCNVCEESDQRRSTIMRFRADGSQGQIYATGLRNSVGLAIAPWDGALYATDNGRDLLGDDYPPCELNQIAEGGFYGWPYLNGDNELDPDMGAGKEALQASAIKPTFNFRAHNAPLGIHFSEHLEKTALVALHGSWNRSQPDGYKVVALKWQADGSVNSSDFVWGFLDNGKIIGRPVDIVSDGMGGYLVSDDYARVIYRISSDSFGGNYSEVDESSTTTVAKADELAEPDSELVKKGQKLFKGYGCQSCHNSWAQKRLSLTQLQDRYTLQSLADFFVTPTPPMPRFDFSAQERQQLAHYLMQNLMQEKSL